MSLKWIEEVYFSTSLIKAKIAKVSKLLLQIRQWIIKGSWAVLDQGLFSGANFLVNILLARWLSPEQYGAFAVALSIFYLLAGFHTAVLTEPMMVFGASKYREQFRKYLGMLLYGHLGLMIPIILLLLGASLIFGSFYLQELQKALLGLAFAVPMILFLWLVRQAFYVRLQPGWAALGGGFYFVLLVGTIYLLQMAGMLSQVTALLGMGASALLISLLFIQRLHPQRVISGNPAPKTVALDHWHYGRWALGTEFLTWFPSNIYFAVLPLWMSLDEIGAIRALVNLALPILMAFTSLYRIILPIMSNTFMHKGMPGVWKVTKYSLFFFLLISLIYLILLSSLGYKILTFLYGTKYKEYEVFVFIIGIYPIGSAIMTCINSTFKAIQHPEVAFFSYLIATLGSCFIGLPLAFFYRVPGALLGRPISAIPSIVFQLLYIQNIRRKDADLAR